MCKYQHTGLDEEKICLYVRLPTNTGSGPLSTVLYRTMSANHRPGMTAAQQAGILVPLIDADISKAEIREA